jgi:hypothetical protein
LQKRLTLSMVATGALASVAWIQTVSGQIPSFPNKIRPVLAKNCFSCHNQKLSTANLNLEAFQDDISAAKHPEVWEKVLTKVKAGQMPPTGMSPLPKTDIAALTTWIDSLLSRSTVGRDTNPGRVVARRLNRVEFNNTIRDLLGVSARPADDFPVDDSGYGFDNIGDVLSISPMLMEKYMSAASKISRLAVYGEPVPDKPTRLARLLNRRSPDANDVLSNGNAGSYLPYSMRGAMYGAWTAPIDGEYEFRLRIANFRQEPRQPRGARSRLEPTPERLKAQAEAAREAAPPRKLVLSIDKQPILTEVVRGTTTFEYDRGEYIARTPLKAGEHQLRASFPELADLNDPRENINPDMRRGLFVDYLEIVGPYKPSAAPPDTYRKLFVCGHSPGEHKTECPRIVVRNLMERAYRRPVSEDELNSKLALVTLAQNEGDKLEEGVRLALEAVLASPAFLFKVEADPVDSNEIRPLNDFELASRLSYFLWASMPDEELFQTARQHKLRQAAVLGAQVRRMLADPKARNLVDNWAAQWLQLRNLGRTKPDPVRFPTVDDELLDAMRRETSLFIGAIIREDRSLLDFIDARFTYLNGPLAKHYGMAGVSGEEFQRVNLDGVQRSGLLTQGAILTVSSYPTRTSPPVRGKWVMENLLGTPPPPPPPDVPVLDESKTISAATMRERMEQHRKDPSCSPCHMVMDPIGFGLESYDAVGKWRTHEGKAQIDASGVLPDGKSFNGAQDLKQILKGESGKFIRNVTEKLLTYALGRGLERHDGPTVDQISARVTSDRYRFSTLVMEIVKSKPFQMRTVEVAKQ